MTQGHWGRAWGGAASWLHILGIGAGPGLWGGPQTLTVEVTGRWESGHHPQMDSMG